MGLSIVIYQALIYVGVFFLLFLSASYFANKIRKNNPKATRKRIRIVTNHMESIQSKIKQAEQKDRENERIRNYQGSNTQNSINVYYEKNRLNRAKSSPDITARQYHFTPEATLYQDQMAYRSTAYYGGGESVTFR